MRRHLALLLLAGLTGCAAPQAPAPSSPPDHAITDQALAGWETFPVDRVPRPLVRLLPSTDPVVVSGTGDWKVTVLTGALELATGLPRGPVSTPEGVPLVSAADAWAALSRPRPERAPGATPTRLRVTSVTLGTTSVDTDRGAREVPAWLFGTDGPVLAWPALEFFAPTATPTLGGTTGGAKSTGNMITVSMPKARQGCPGNPIFRYEPEVRESRTAVAVGLRTVVTDQVVPGDPRGGACAQDTMLVMEEYQVTLAAPLGARVLVDRLGWPVAVG
ncbi:hypothetical protein R8Z50_32490 [Longispora sp. K20-0274]|uniref:hypothetical protein n=1 Tax=Longispora sp. K20-0274 TaxID=3088255 RepID=UPI003999ECF6